MNTAAEWLEKWDAGEPVWTIEMGGMGPGYEQAIQVTVAEILRWLVTNNVTIAELDDDAKAYEQGIREELLEADPVGSLGLTGAQWGAAVNLAAHLFRRGPDAVMRDEAVEDRHIQVSRTFPGAAS